MRAVASRSTECRWVAAATAPLLLVSPAKSVFGSDFLGVDMTVLAYLLALGVAFLSGQADGWRLGSVHPSTLAPAVPFFFIACVSAVATSSLDKSPGTDKLFFLLFQCAVLLLVALLTVRSRHGLRCLLGVYGVAGVLLAGYVVVIEGPSQAGDRAGAGSEIFAPSRVAGVALLLLVLAASRGQLSWLVASPLAAVCGLAVVWSASRAAALATLVTLLLLLLLVRSRSRVLIFLVGAVVLWLISLSDSGYVQDRLGRVEDPVRLAMIDRSIDVGLGNPLLGIGYGSGEWVVGFRTYQYPHNIFAEAFAEMGLLGLMSLLYLFAILLRRCWRRRESGVYLASGLLTVFAIVNFALSSQTSDRYLWLLILPALLLGQLEVAERRTHMIRGNSGRQPNPLDRTCLQRSWLPPDGFSARRSGIQRTSLGGNKFD